MARKTLSDFNNDHQAYADYLESAECLQDDGIDVYAEGRNVYTPRNGNWMNGHGHYVDNSGLDKDDYERTPDDERAKDRPWYNKWLKYCEELCLTLEEIEFLETFELYDFQQKETDENKSLIKRK